MTVSGDFIPEDDLQEGGADYPTAFGIQFTPTVLGGLIALLGVGLAVFLFIRLVQPTLQEKQQLEASIRDKQAQLADSADARAQAEAVEAELQAAIARRRQVYDLFASEEELDTLMIDINQQILPTNAGIDDVRGQLIELGVDPELVGARLVEVTPDYEASGVFVAPEAAARASAAQDAPPYPAELSGDLERRVYNVAFQGDFAQTLSIIRNVERLEPLLLVREFNVEISDINEDFSDFVGAKVLDTTMVLEALIPVGSPDDLPEIAPPPAEGEEGAAPADGAAAPPAN